MIIETNPKLYVKFIDNNKGMGVYTNSKISKGEIIESCYSIPVNISIKEYHAFFFQYNGTDTLLPLGYGCIYNHSDNPNISWEILDFQKRIIKFFAIDDIEPDIELCHNYGAGYWLTNEKKII